MNLSEKTTVELVAGVKLLDAAATEPPWTVEQHGGELALYACRDRHHHGFRLMQLAAVEWLRSVGLW